ncbi:hypothetical protein [Herbaspirillum rubrisubalbicans]|uniref:hypothetical protein n=1 Tax=Herbaspirillum rubrisubalbicans TaxID=80842 RepID=UPI00073A148C|nr:hypothetical protein [Herbaspirillum rubrisubalbicans]
MTKHSALKKLVKQTVPFADDAHLMDKEEVQGDDGHRPGGQTVQQDGIPGVDFYEGHYSAQSEHCKLDVGSIVWFGSPVAYGRKGRCSARAGKAKPR